MIVPQILVPGIHQSQSQFWVFLGISEFTKNASLGENANKIHYYTSNVMVVHYTCNKVLGIPSKGYPGNKNQILMLIDQILSSFANEKRNDVIGAFNSTSRYLDDLLKIDNIHFEQNISH